MQPPPWSPWPGSLRILCLSLRHICVWTCRVLKAACWRLCISVFTQSFWYSHNNQHLLNIIYIRVQQTLPISKKKELWQSNHKLFINDGCSLFQQNIICDTEVCISHSFHVIKTCSFPFLLTLKNKKCS